MIGENTFKRAQIQESVLRFKRINSINLIFNDFSQLLEALKHKGQSIYENT